MWSTVGATLRANARYELIEFARLSSSQKDVLRSLALDPEFYGVLRPRTGTGEPLKSVCKNTALLFMTLAEPGPAPSYIQAHDEACDEAIAELVLQGILELEVDGGFVSGPDAYLAIHPEPSLPSDTQRASLSLAALQYGGSLRIDDAIRLSARLYCYNRWPLSPRWTRKFTSTDDVTSYLGIFGAGGIARTLKRNWLFDDGGGWLGWRWRQDSRVDRMHRSRYKLYVSPSPPATAFTLARFVEAVTKVRAPYFKVGKDLPGLLRPDKIVAYFDTYEHLAQGAACVREAVGTCPVQGVPFAALIGSDGLLSWGMDPPADDYALPWERSDSWRVWVSNRLAQALVDAQSTGCLAVEPWRYAIKRIASEGVDPNTWAPTPDLQFRWSRGPSEAVAWT